jgi:hypothetical protein
MIPASRPGPYQSRGRTGKTGTSPTREELAVLREDYLFNYRTIKSYTNYACTTPDGAVEREVSFHVDLGPSTERKGDVFPVYQVPTGKMACLSDWSFNGGWLLTRELAIGGSLGRITAQNDYIYVLNCAVYSGEMEVYSPSRPIRYLPGEWIAVCFHQIGKPLDIQMRATFRFTETPAPEKPFETKVFNWEAGRKDEPFNPENH